MPFEAGNRYGRMGQPVTDALRRAALAGDGRLLRQACDKALRKAAAGDLAALAWIADRLDGKATLKVDADHDGALVVSWIVGTQSVQHQPVTIEHQPAVGVPSSAAAIERAGAPSSQE